MGIEIKHGGNGNMEIPKTPHSQPSKPFGMRRTPFNPMTGKHLPLKNTKVLVKIISRDGFDTDYYYYTVKQVALDGTEKGNEISNIPNIGHTSAEVFQTGDITTLFRDSANGDYFLNKAFGKYIIHSVYDHVLAIIKQNRGIGLIIYKGADANDTSNNCIYLEQHANDIALNVYQKSDRIAILVQHDSEDYGVEIIPKKLFAANMSALHINNTSAGDSPAQTGMNVSYIKIDDDRVDSTASHLRIVAFGKGALLELNQATDATNVMAPINMTSRNIMPNYPSNGDIILYKNRLKIYNGSEWKTVAYVGDTVTGTVDGVPLDNGVIV